MTIPGNFVDRLAFFGANFSCEIEDATKRLNGLDQVYINKIMDFTVYCFYPEEIRTSEIRNLVLSIAYRKILQKTI